MAETVQQTGESAGQPLFSGVKKKDDKMRFLRPKSMYLTAAFLGKQYGNLNMGDSGTTDCSISSSLKCVTYDAHYSLVDEWLPNPSRALFLQLSPAAIELLLDIIYYREITQIDVDVVYELATFAEKKDYSDLLFFVLENFYDEIGVGGICWAWLAARENDLECELPLRKKVGDCVYWLLKERIAGFEKFLEAPVEAVLEIAEDDQVFWKNGRMLTEVIIAWSKANVAAAKSNCKELFSTIRFSSIKERRECLERYRQAFLSIGMDEVAVRRETCVYSSMKPRMPTGLLLYLGGWASRRGTSSAMFYDVYTNHWATLPALEMPLKISYHHVHQIGDFLYSFGGYDFTTFKSDVWRFDFEELKWEMRSSIPDDRGYFSSLLFKNKVYIFGGYDFFHRLATNWIYDPEENKWTAMTPLSVGRSDSASVIYNGKILVSGGFDGERTLNRVEVFDPEKPEDGWTDFAPMKDPRSGHAMVVFRDTIFAIGGFQHGTSTDTAEYFDASCNEWKSAPSMGSERSTFSAIVFEDAIYTIGGHSLDTSTSVVEKFDGEAWTVVHCLPKAIAAGAVVYVDNPKNMPKLLQRANV